MSNDLGLNEVTVLSALLFKEKYGLEIIESIKEETGDNISLGGLYTTLNRLEKKGYVKGRWGEATAERGGNRRKYYRLTGAGERVLRDVNATLTVLWKGAFQKCPSTI